MNQKFEKKPVGFKAYKEFREQFNTELVYTRADLARMENELNEKWEKILSSIQVMREGKDCNVMMMLIQVSRHPDGLLIRVK